MNLRLTLPILLAFLSLNLSGQTITSITYNGGVATLTSSQPPAGIVYYWQGTSCGTLMNNTGTTTLATTDGTQYIRGYNSTSASWFSACASTIVMFPDVTAPVLSGVTAGPIETGTDISATSNEDGMIYLVPDGTTADLGSITAAQVAQATAVANVASTLSTTGLTAGDYVVYAVDASNNISAASSAITISYPAYTDFRHADSDPVKLYPANVVDILYIQSDIRVTAVNIYSLQGAQLMKINEPVDQVDMSSLQPGIYIVSVKLENETVFNGKITKR